MLAWGAAAALPFLIHLWSRRRYRQENWAAMAFLMAAVEKNASRVRLEQWLLLAVRMTMLGLFALALADPQFTISAGQAGDPSSGNTHIILVIDGSYSMGYQDNDKSRFEEAKEIAKRRVASGQPGDAYALVLMTDPPHVVIAEPVVEMRRVGREIDDLRLTHGGASLAANLTEIEAIALRTSESADRHGLCQVVFLTDLQRATWGQVDTEESRTRLTRLESIATLELIDLSQADEANLAI